MHRQRHCESCQAADHDAEYCQNLPESTQWFPLRSVCAAASLMLLSSTRRSEPYS
jgi:hypothetical protein